MSTTTPDNPTEDPLTSMARTERISGRLDSALLARVDEAVEELGLRNRSELMRRAVMAYLEMTGESADYMVRVRLTPDQLLFCRQMMAVGEAESVGELVRTAMRNHMKALPEELRERNDTIAYYSNVKESMTQGGYTP